MKNLETLFNLWRPLTKLANEVGESHWVVRKWRQRKSIPSSAWPRVIAAAARKGHDLTADDLLRMHTRNSTRLSPLRQRCDGGA